MDPGTDPGKKFYVLSWVRKTKSLSRWGPSESGSEENKNRCRWKHGQTLKAGSKWHQAQKQLREIKRKTGLTVILSAQRRISRRKRQFGNMLCLPNLKQSPGRLFRQITRLQSKLHLKSPDKTSETYENITKKKKLTWIQMGWGW